MAKRRTLHGKKLLIASAGLAAMGAVGCDDRDAGNVALPPEVETVDEVPVVGNLVAPPPPEPDQEGETEGETEGEAQPEAEAESETEAERGAQGEDEPAPQQRVRRRPPELPRPPPDMGPIGNLVAPPPPTLDER